MLLEEQREVAFSAIPELVQFLESHSLLDLEHGLADPLAKVLRLGSQPGLTVAAELGGAGASAVTMAKLLTWVGSRCPSLAVMMTMHHHTVAGMMAGSRFFPGISSLLTMIAKDRLLVASAFSEGRAHAPNLESKMVVREIDGAFAITGNKRPCTLTNHFDVLTLGVNYIDAASVTHIGIGVAFADNPGIKRLPFWSAPQLRAADSHEIVLKDLMVPKKGSSGNRVGKLRVRYGSRAA